MAASDVSICSNALILLGAQPISSLDQVDDRAKLAASLYESVRDSTLRSHPWNCCIKRVALSPDEAAPQTPDWSLQYTIPDDFLKALALGEAGGEAEFKLEGRKLLCDENPLYLRYVAKVTNPGEWDTMLVRAMELAMAAAMAYAITQSASMRDSMRQELEMHLKRARAVDGQDDTPETLGDSPLLTSRWRSAGGNIWRS